MLMINEVELAISDLIRSTRDLGGVMYFVT